MNSKHKEKTIVQPAQEIAKDSALLIDTRRTCEICNKTLMNESNLKKHMDRVHSEEVQETTAPGSDVTTPSTAGTSSTANDASDNTCGICGKTLMSEANLKKHMERVHAQESRQAPADDHSSTSSTADTGSENSCGMCGKILKNESNLKKHMEKVHASTKEKVGVAKALSQSKIRSLLAQTIDESTSMSDFSCTICDKTLKTKANLEKHMSWRHIYEKFCEKCGQRKAWFSFSTI